MDTPICDNLPTPPSSSVAASHHPSPLPKPRKNALKPGGPKESALIRYLDQGVRKVQKRSDDRFKTRKTYTGDVSGASDAQAYRSFQEAAKDMNGLIDVIWVSGTPNLQIPYLLNMAVMISELITLFKPSPQATFNILDKMDVAFSSLLQGTDYDSGLPLPGFESRAPFSTTYKVRLKGIVERTRLIAVKVMSGEYDGEDGEIRKVDEDTTGGEETDAEEYVKFEGFKNDDDAEDDEDGDDDRWEEGQIAKVYERTIGELGDVLGGPPIGIITDD
ncbi:hypothetical protein K504DRAFT_371457 [Pleomassaria siparia CBS 279.74]|uniref:Meiotic recombination protein DMC1 n=1 Tax=Pleomassaria siparia CBS 279.74 TaxID=1314801 RepID=A0A6G1KLM8_9PLEO|nr:hypothetical protein K504DRAFT_371457 [Pleomassaria siparia CBS 279.74]